MSMLVANPDLHDYYLNMADKTKDEALRNGLATMIAVANTVAEKDVKSYVVSDSLLHALDTVDCEEVGPWHLAGVQTFNFLLNKNTLKIGNISYNEMSVLILPPTESCPPFKNLDTEHHKISIFIGDNTKVEQSMPALYLGTMFKEGSTFEDILKGAERDMGTWDGNSLTVEDKVRVFRLALNLILYVHSPDPDIMQLKPQIYNMKYFRDNYFKKSKDERHLLGIYSLGWDFHGREYSVHIGTRRGHFKWQPCGKQWAQRKLIFVQATTVNYGRNKHEDNNGDKS